MVLPPQFAILKMPTIQIVAAFNERYLIDDRTGCHVWTWSRHPKGYGHFHFKSVFCLAHRFAFCVANGYLRPDRMICHECDNPPCCNPAHLFEGTAKTNAEDRKAKGRHILFPNGAAEGIANINGRLTDDQVRAIFLDPRPARIVAPLFDICRAHVNDIRRRKWRKSATKDLLFTPRTRR